MSDQDRLPPTIYRCGWCGTPVNENGGLLDEDTRAEYPHPDLYLDAHADAEVRHVNGFCCPNGDNDEH